MCYNFCACPLHSRITSQLLQWGWQRWMEIPLWSGEFFLYLQFVSNCLQGHAVRTGTAPSLAYESHLPSSKTTVYTCLLLLPDVSTTWKRWFERKKKNQKKHLELEELNPPSPPSFSFSICLGCLHSQHQIVQGDSTFATHGRIRDIKWLFLSPSYLNPLLHLTVSEFTPRDLWLKLHQQISNKKLVWCPSPCWNETDVCETMEMMALTRARLPGWMQQHVQH